MFIKADTMLEPPQCVLVVSCMQSSCTNYYSIYLYVFFSVYTTPPFLS